MMKKIYTLMLFAFTLTAVQAQVNVTFRVDMSGETVSDDGVHVAGAFQGWDPAGTLMTDDDGDGIYEVTIENMVADTYLYKYVNGMAWASDGGANEGFGADSGLADCGIDDGFAGHNREVTIPDVIAYTVETYTYNTCDIVTEATNVVNPSSTVKGITITPNPFADRAVLTLDSPVFEAHDVRITNINGQIVRHIQGFQGQSLEISRDNLAPGMYFLMLTNQKGEVATSRLMISK